jgi:hypothetical protein
VRRSSQLSRRRNYSRENHDDLRYLETDNGGLKGLSSFLQNLRHTVCGMHCRSFSQMSPQRTLNSIFVQIMLTSCRSEPLIRFGGTGLKSMFVWRMTDPFVLIFRSNSNAMTLTTLWRRIGSQQLGPSHYTTDIYCAPHTWARQKSDGPIRVRLRFCIMAQRFRV